MSALLYKMIGEGEHQQQDFKFCINDSKKIAKSLVAFANTNGGRLLIGVKDNGKVAGVRTEEEYYMIESAAKIYSNPPVSFSVKQWFTEGKTVLEIGVLPSNKKPHYALDDSGKWLAYTRVDDENILTHRIQLAVWKKLKRKQGIHFTYSDDEKFLVNYLQENEKITFSKFVHFAHISRKKAEEILSNFIIMDVIQLITTHRGVFFTLNSNFADNEFKNSAPR